MIIFNLDGTLANCEHRRHFVDLDKIYPSQMGLEYSDGRKWKPDWPAFYEACDKDEPILPTQQLLDGIYFNSKDQEFFLSQVQIWSGRCESVREKTKLWLSENILFDKIAEQITLKMRPIGNIVPDEQLKEQWLDDWIARSGKPIDMVFESNPKSIQMWKRRGTFVFNCQQSDGEF